MYPTGRPKEVRPTDRSRETPRSPVIDPRRLLLHDPVSAKELDLTHARIRAFGETVKYLEQVSFTKDGAIERPASANMAKTTLERTSSPNDSDSDLYVQPLDLSRATKPNRDADSPLDLTVKTTRRSADTTGAGDMEYLMKRHDQVSPRMTGGICDTTNTPRNPKKEKLLQYERVHQQYQLPGKSPQYLTPQQHRQQQLHMQQILLQRQQQMQKHQQQQQQHQQQQHQQGQPKSKETAAVDSTLQILRQQELMKAYQTAFLKGHLPFAAPPSPLATQPMTQGLPHPHVNRVPRPPSKGHFPQREGEIRAPSPAMSPHKPHTPGKESPKCPTPKASVGKPETSPVATPSRASPGQVPSHYSPASMEQMRLLHQAMSRRYMLGSDGKPLPGFPMPVADFRLPNGAVRMPNGMVQPRQSLARKPEPAAKPLTAAAPLRIEIPDSNHGATLPDKMSPAVALRHQSRLSYVLSRPKMGMIPPRFAPPKPQSKPGDGVSPPPLSIADTKVPGPIPLPPVRGTSPLPSPQMPVLSPHTKSPVPTASGKCTPTTDANSDRNEDKTKTVELDSKEAVAAIMQELLPQFVKQGRPPVEQKRDNGTSQSSGDVPVPVVQAPSVKNEEKPNTCISPKLSEHPVHSADKDTVKIKTESNESENVKQEIDCERIDDKNQTSDKGVNIEGVNAEETSPETDASAKSDSTANDSQNVKVRPPCGRIVQKVSSPTSTKSAEAGSSQSQSGPSTPSQRPPPLRNVWSTIRIENGEIAPMPMPITVPVPPKKEPQDSPKKRQGDPSSPRRRPAKKMTPLMKRSVQMRNKMGPRPKAVKSSLRSEFNTNQKGLRNTCGLGKRSQRSRAEEAEELHGARRRTILDQLVNSDGYVADAKKTKQAADDLYADPSLLDREERALRRAMLQFGEMEDEDPEDDQDVNKAGSPRKRRSGEKQLEPCDPKKRKLVREYKSRKGGDVYEPRTRTQAAATKSGRPIPTYNKNAAYERELRREEVKAKLLKAKRVKRRRKRRTPAQRTSDTGNDAPETEIVPEAEEDDSRRIFRNKSRSAAALRLWQRRRIEQAKQWSYNSAVNKAGDSGKARSRRVKVRRGRRGRAGRLPRAPPAVQYIEGDSTYDFHDEACADLPDVRPVPPEMKRMVVNKNSGETILHRAARLGYEDVVLYCLETGTAEVNARDNAGYTSLHECCVRGNLNIAKYLIYYGANVNCSATDGTRPIHDAIDNDHPEVARLLLSYGADPLLATYSGRTALKLARYPRMRTLIRGFFADLNGPNEEEGETETPWDFHGSSFISDPVTRTGYDIFTDIPSDPEDGDHEIEFEFSDGPHLPTYKLELENENGPKNYVLMTDVLEHLKLSRQEFMERHPKICVCTKRIRTAIFRQQVELTGCDDVKTSPVAGSRRQAQFTELLPLDYGVRELLGTGTVRMDYISEDIKVHACAGDEDMESVMSDDTVIYEATDVANEDDFESEAAPMTPPPPTATEDVVQIKVEKPSEIPAEPERLVPDDVPFPQVKTEIDAEPMKVENPVAQDYVPNSRPVPLVTPVVPHHVPLRIPEHFRRYPQVLPDQRQDRRVETVTSATASNMAPARPPLPTSDPRMTLDLNSAIYRTITHAMQKPHAPDMAAVNREAMSKSMTYPGIPYMYSSPHLMRTAGHRYSPLAQQHYMHQTQSRQSPHTPPTSRQDYYLPQQRHSIPAGMYQMSGQHHHREPMPPHLATARPNLDALPEQKRTTETMDSTYMFKVATTPEEYYLTNKQRLSANNSPHAQFHPQRNPSILNGVQRPPHQPPHPHVPAHVQTRPERLPPYL